MIVSLNGTSGTALVLWVDDVIYISEMPWSFESNYGGGFI
jgi:hypothetical protein